MPYLTTNLRSPSPVLPGAWPRTPLRSRSLTCPTPTSAPDSMHVDIARVRQKLAPEPPASLSSIETLAPSMPSESSRLTRFSSANSMSALGNLSVSTTLEDVLPEALDHKTASSNSETRIYQLPSPENSPDSVRSAHARRVLPQPDEPSFSSEASFPPSSATPSPNSRTTSSLPESPIIFVSPTSSNRRTPPAIRRLRAAGNQSYSFTSDEDAEYDDSGLLRLGSESSPSSPGSSLLSSSHRRRDVSVVIVSPISESYGSSTEDLQLVLPQLDLTSLSLPGSMIMDDSLDVAATASPSPLSIGNNTGSDAPWTLSLTGTPVSEHQLSPQSAFTSSPISISANTLPLSPSLRAQLENPHDTHLVQFPSPTTSASPAQPFVSSPVEVDVAPETSAAQYANALTSAWSLAPQIDPVGLELSNPNVRESDYRVKHERRTVITSDATQQPKRSVLAKVKRFGSKVKHLLQGKSKEPLEIAVSSSRKTTNSPYPRTPDPNARNGGENFVAARRTPPTLERLDLGSFDLERHIAIPPHRVPSPSRSGPVTRARKPRPSLTAQTYSPTATTETFHPINAGGLERRDSPSARAEAPDPVPLASNNTSSVVQDGEHTLQSPITPEQNKRRLSLSAISNHLIRPSSPAGSAARPSTPISVTQRRPRPTSALILPSIIHHSPSSQGHRQTRNINRASISHPIGPVYRRSTIYPPPPPGLDTSPRARTVRLAVPAVDYSSSPHTTTPVGRSNGLNASNRRSLSRCLPTDQEQIQSRSDSERDRNRFSLTTSLSTLSSFAAGLVESGSWAKFDTTK
ncbi:hypothetical protein BT96DRAFT_1011746 [Gymnopus androsaceus JB14]|uniref:Uncharacterized protein n=1 Tax=Gymnopus androsaceus JB14 TaxID=1447944 RepID=A0A6A4ITL7_9AGAR|nr:hypothetical protein BT96DRAFT_1011746 [Gymnopus androsaceus JB14]